MAKSCFVPVRRLSIFLMATTVTRSLLNRRSMLQLSALAVAGTATSYYLRNQRSIGENVGEHASVQKILSDQSSPTTIVPAADVMIISFNDYGCAACRMAYPELQKAIEEDGRSRLTYKDWPILGPASEQAAQVALASNYQGIYASFHDTLMATNGLTQKQLKMAVERSGGNWAQILADLKIHKQAIENQLNNNRLQAFTLGLEGTPAYLIGPILVRGSANKGQIQNVIKEARSLIG